MYRAEGGDQKSRLRSTEDEGRARRVSQETKEQTVSGRKLMSRSNGAAGSSVMFIEFGSVEVNGDLGQVVLADYWGQEPDRDEAEERNKDTETASVDDPSEKLAVN